MSLGGAVRYGTGREAQRKDYVFPCDVLLPTIAQRATTKWRLAGLSGPYLLFTLAITTGGGLKQSIDWISHRALGGQLRNCRDMYQARASQKQSSCYSDAARVGISLGCCTALLWNGRTLDRRGFDDLGY
jgi:hypothetical protein